MVKNTEDKAAQETNPGVKVEIESTGTAHSDFNLDAHLDLLLGEVRSSH